MQLGSKEFYDIQSQFEKDLNRAAFARIHDFSKPTREQLQNLPKGEFYNNGEVNKAFKIYLAGYALGKCKYQN